jgi:hypothetical protein
MTTRRRVTIYVALYVWALALFLTAHWARVAADPGLMGEEIAQSFRNPVYFAHRLQADGYATGFSAHAFFLIGTYVLPLSVSSGRVFKMLFVALLAPLLAGMVLRTNPRVSPLVAAFPGVLFPLLPSMAFFASLGADFVLDCVFTLALLWLALDFTWNPRAQQGFWNRLVAMGLLTVWSLHFYAGSLSVIATAYAVLLARSLVGHRSARDRLKAVALFAFFCAVVAVVACWPYAYFEGPLVVLKGGGSLDLRKEMLLHAVRYNYDDLFVRSSTYLVGEAFAIPVFPWRRGGAMIMVLVLVGIVSVARHRRGVWILVMGFSNLGVSLLSGEFPGIRRSVPVVLAICLLAALGFQFLLDQRAAVARTLISPAAVAAIIAFTSDLWGPVRWEYWALGIGALGPLVLWSRAGIARHHKAILQVLMGGMLVAPSITFAEVCLHMRARFKAPLSREFVFLPGKNYEETIEELVARMQEGQISLSRKDYSFDNLVLLDLICKRRGLACVPPRIELAGHSFDRRLSLRYELQDK